MKRTILLLAFIFIHITSFAQLDLRQVDLLRISLNDTSNLFIEKYEIDLAKKQIFYITPIANYLHVKGEKLRTKVITSKAEWHNLENVLYKIDLEEIEKYIQTDSTKNTYSLEVYKNKDVKNFRFSKADVPIEIKNTFEEIKNITGTNRVDGPATVR
ncbi:hypothetical protein FVR03_19860 [Pontibacter qinzhouensis]|uniref:Uncharacterized protein n=1 Tax=Pontibacter qinzhouensis TaxID=2603253 RepID=A0A5C8J4Z8_9BACT|nr:hypothetical protein [Pontibacter qinzhouensis]TXK31142.1 hypothetical protein FVR03_19860 [Pontibacter qinzhouensis]